MKSSVTQQQLETKAKNIKLIVLDVDGVLTDGQLFYSDNTIETKGFHVHDGQGIQLALQNGIPIAVITSRESPIVAHRMAELGVNAFMQGQKNKIAAFESLQKQFNVDDTSTAYVGDDLVDLALIRRAGLGIAVANANPLVASYADWQTKKSGGFGAVREVCDFILEAQSKLTIAVEPFL